MMSKFVIGTLQFLGFFFFGLWILAMLWVFMVAL